VLNFVVSVVAFKNLCVSIPLKGDLQTRIKFPTAKYAKFNRGPVKMLYFPRKIGCNLTNKIYISRLKPILLANGLVQNTSRWRGLYFN
jgi:hypothetical protein